MDVLTKEKRKRIRIKIRIRRKTPDNHEQGVKVWFWFGS
jgi:hypothetical protein